MFKLTIHTDCPQSGIAADSEIVGEFRIDRYGRRFADFLVPESGMVWVSYDNPDPDTDRTYYLLFAPETDREFGAGQVMAEVGEVIEGDWSPCYRAYANGASYTWPVELGLHFTLGAAKSAVSFVAMLSAGAGC